MGVYLLVSSGLIILGLCGFLVAAILLSLGLLVTKSNSGNRSVLPSGALLLVAAFLCVAYLGELVSATYAQAVSWRYALTFLQAVLPVTWFVASISLVGNLRFLRGRRLLLIAVIPLLTLLTIALPFLRPAFWQSRAYVGITGVLVSQHRLGWWAWLQFGYSVLLTVAGVLQWLRAWRSDSPPGFRIGFGFSLLSSIFLFFFLGEQLIAADEIRIVLLGLAAALASASAIYGILDGLLPGVLMLSRRAVVDTTRMIIVALDSKGRVQDMNPAAEAFWQHPLREYIGLSYKALLEGCDSSFDLEDDHVGDIRLVTTWQDHPDRFYEIVSQVMEGRGRRVLGRLLAITDVTARVAAEAEVKRSRAWYRAILEQAPSMIMVLDREGCIQLINQAPEGREIESVVGQSIYELIPSEHARRLENALAHVFDNGTNTSYEHQGTEDGAWHTNSLAPIMEDGKVVQATLIGTDITAQMEAQRALVESEQRYRAIFETAGTGLLIIGQDTIVRMANQLVSDLSGLSLNQIVGHSFTQLFAPSERERMLEYHRRRRMPDGNAPSNYECRLLQVGGQERIAFLNVSLVPGTTQSVVSILDVTEQRRTEERLRHALKLEAIGQLAGGVAHDFNNLLTVINGSAEFVLDELSSDSPARKDTLEILRAGNRAADLTRQLLAFSRRQVLEMSRLSLNDVVSGVAEMLKRLIGEHITLDLVLALDLWDVQADATQLEQVVINLCINARDAMPDGGSIRLSTRNCELQDELSLPNASIAPGKYAILAIEDTGTGMSPEVMEHLFEPFFTTKEVGKGTGLGLSSVYGTVTQLGGHVYCQSELGRGTIFEIYLNASEGIAVSHQEAVDQQILTLAAGTTVLVVEDQTDVRRLTVRMLEAGGYNVLEASDGLDALDIGAEYTGSIDVVLTDVVMPGMQGREMISRLRQARDDFAVIYATGYSDQVDEVRAQANQDGDVFLSKPYTVAELMDAIRRALL